MCFSFPSEGQLTFLLCSPQTHVCVCRDEALGEGSDVMRVQFPSKAWCVAPVFAGPPALYGLREEPTPGVRRAGSVTLQA